MPWGKVNYSSAQQALLHSQGFLLIGDRDSYVSYEIASATASASASCTFHMVDASDHGFDSREREDEAIAVTVEWLINEHGKQE